MLRKCHKCNLYLECNWNGYMWDALNWIAHTPKDAYMVHQSSGSMRLTPDDWEWCKNSFVFCQSVTLSPPKYSLSWLHVLHLSCKNTAGSAVRYPTHYIRFVLKFDFFHIQMQMPVIPPHVPMWCIFQWAVKSNWWCHPYVHLKCVMAGCSSQYCQLKPCLYFVFPLYIWMFCGCWLLQFICGYWRSC